MPSVLLATTWLHQRWISQFTEIEVAVWDAMARGEGYGEIGARFHLSPLTVKDHAENIRAKMRISSTANPNQTAVFAGMWPYARDCQTYLKQIEEMEQREARALEFHEEEKALILALPKKQAVEMLRLPNFLRKFAGWWPGEDNFKVHPCHDDACRVRNPPDPFEDLLKITSVRTPEERGTEANHAA